MFEPVFRHFLAGIFKNFFRDIIAYTLESKSYFMENFVRSTIVGPGEILFSGSEIVRAVVGKIKKKYFGFWA